MDHQGAGRADAIIVLNTCRLSRERVDSDNSRSASPAGFKIRNAV
jgi:hypothetical protein